MRKSEIFAVIFSIVADESEISADLITSKSRVSEVVDARHILVYLASRYGVYKSILSSKLSLSNRSIEIIICKFSDRLQSDKSFKYLYNRVLNKVRESCEEDAN